MIQKQKNCYACVFLVDLLLCLQHCRFVLEARLVQTTVLRIGKGHRRRESKSQLFLLINVFVQSPCRVQHRLPLALERSTWLLAALWSAPGPGWAGSAGPGSPAALCCAGGAGSGAGPGPSLRRHSRPVLQVTPLP